MAAAAPAAPGIPADWALVPIHPYLTYQQFYRAFVEYIYYGQVNFNDTPDVLGPMIEEIEATDNYLDRIVNVHRKYVTHFFRNDPKGAQQALEHYLEFVLNGIYNRGLSENWRTYGPESVLPFIRSYVEHGASVLRLRNFVKNFVNVHYYLEDPDRNSIFEQLKRAILLEIINELRDKAFKRRKHAVLAWNQVYQKQLAAEAAAAEAEAAAAAAAAPAGNNNLPPLERVAPGNGNQGGGRRRRSIRKRKASKKTRRSRHVSHNK